MDAIQLPLYQPLVNLLEAPGFMTMGRTLGIGLAYAYPYTHEQLYKTMPEALKGVDMMLYETLLASGLEFKFVRILVVDSGYERKRKVSLYAEDFTSMNLLNEEIETGDVEKFLPSDWKRLGPIQWLRRPTHDELEMAYMAASTNYRPE